METGCIGSDPAVGSSSPRVAFPAKKKKKKTGKPNSCRSGSLGEKPPLSMHYMHTIVARSPDQLDRSIPCPSIPPLATRTCTHTYRYSHIRRQWGRHSTPLNSIDKRKWTWACKKQNKKKTRKTKNKCMCHIQQLACTYTHTHTYICIYTRKTD